MLKPRPSRLAVRIMPATRRRFLQTFAAGAAGLLAACGRAGPEKAAPATTGNPYAALEAGRFLGDRRVLAEITTGPAFTEGPAVGPDGRVFFTNIPANQILVWDPATQRHTVFREDSHGANGLCFTPGGDLLVCEGTAGRITRLDPSMGRVTVLADRYDGQPLQAPNDLCLAANGQLYVSSRGTQGPPTSNPRAVYWLDPDGTLHRLLAEPDVHNPNGVALSPDEQTFYLIEADGAEGRNRHLRAYDRAADGSLHRPRVLYDFYPGRSGDGMAVDAQGNLYVAAGLHARRDTSETLDTRPGIHVFTPQGVLVDYAETPVDTVTNCTFGGEDLRTLYVTCGPLLLSFRTQIPGKANYRIGA
ncbi:MAG: hypothetical protein D6685_16615 [Bacteroidetes bacterium]|nr:MAG: hypothetical protein D6685_16615 [Bacteroidota bacterium]